MAGLTSRRQRGDGGPIVEDLKESGTLRPEVAPQSIRTYDEKRSDYVERPAWGDNGWEQLAKALGKFNPVLDNMARAKGIKDAEDAAARGKEEMQRSKLDWKTFLEQNPEYQGLSPHFERGYKAAELNTRAQEHHAALQQFYTEGGLMNQVDPEKVSEALKEFSKNWIQENVKYGDYDSDIYVENFLKHAQQAEGAFLTRHVKDRADEHVNRGKGALGEFVVSTADTTYKQTPNIAHPTVLKETNAKIASQLAAQMQAMEASGMKPSETIEAVSNAIINTAMAWGEEGFGDEFLAVADQIPTGTGTLGGRPEFKAKVKTLMDRWEGERRRKTLEYYSLREKRRTVETQEKRDGISQYISQCDDEGTMPDEREISRIAGGNHKMLAMEMYSSYRHHKQSPENFSPEKQARVAKREQDILLGLVGEDEISQGFGSYGWKVTNSHLALARKVASGDDPVTKAQSSNEAKAGAASLKAQVGALFRSTTSSAQGVPVDVETAETRAIQDEAVGHLLRRVALFTEDYIDTKKKEPSAAQRTEVISLEVERLKGIYQGRSKARAASAPDTPFRIEQPGNFAEYSESFWKMNKGQWLSEEEAKAAKAHINTEDASSVTMGYMNKFGLSHEQTLWMLKNQFELHGLIPVPKEMTQQIPPPPKKEEKKKSTPYFMAPTETPFP